MPSVRFRVALLAPVVAATALGVLPWAAAGPASADPLTDAQAQANQVAAQIQAEGQRLDILSQQYDAAQQQVQQLASQQAAIEGRIAQTQAEVAQARSELHDQAVDAYTSGAVGSGLESLFSAHADQAVAASTYRQVATGNLSGAIDNLRLAQSQLQAQQASLAATEAQAQAAAAQLSSARQSAAQTQAQLQATENGLQGQIKQLVAQKQAEEAAAAAAAYQAELAAQQAAAQLAAQRAAAQLAAQQAAAQRAANAQGSSLDNHVSQPSSTSASNQPPAQEAAAAVAAAESQLGVPYVWGAEQPGVGFDCSGLTQWAWSQAGVSIPRTAQEQYDAITHISLTELEPGDLLFWNDGTSSIQHVAMYVGNNEVIQAPYTGSSVSYAPIWPNGLVGAGRP